MIIISLIYGNYIYVALSLYLSIFIIYNSPCSPIPSPYSILHISAIYILRCYPNLRETDISEQLFAREFRRVERECKRVYHYDLYVIKQYG